MPEIEMFGEIYEWETTVDNRTITIADVKTGEWTKYQDTDNVVGDPDFYEDWEDWIDYNWNYLIWMPGDAE